MDKRQNPSPRCAPADWRPTTDDQHCRNAAAALLGGELAGWLERATERPWDSIAGAHLLLEHADSASSGYRIARRLEEALAIEPDTELLDILDDWLPALDRSVQDREAVEAARLGITAPFRCAMSALCHAPDGPVKGVVFRIPDDPAGFAAFVAEEHGFDSATGELAVISVRLEDIEITGPAPDGSDSLQTHVLSAVISHRAETAMEDLSRAADADLGMSDAKIMSLIEAKERAGIEKDEAYGQVVDAFAEEFREAVDDSDPHRTWLAALLCAAALRRCAMRSGVPPTDDNEMQRLVDVVSAPHEDEAAHRAITTSPATIH